MSLTSTWVKAVDGKYYKEPLLYGDDWFLCFDDDDPPELVIAHIPNQTREAARKRADDLLTTLGIKGKTLDNGQRGHRGVPPKWKKMRDSVAFDLRITAPIPVPTISDTIADKPGVGTIYNFGERL